MGIVTDIRRWLARGLVTPGANPRTGVTVSSAATQGSPLAIATVYRCVKLLSDSVAQLPVDCLRLKGGIMVKDTSSPLSYLLTVQPNPNMSAFDFWAQAVADIYLSGNAYILPVMSTTAPVVESLYLLRPECVSHDTTLDRYTVSDDQSGITGVYGEDAMIHIKGMTGYDRKRGISVVEHARTVLTIAHTGDTETLDRFRNGGNVRGIISNGQSVQGYGDYADEQLDAVARDIDGAFRVGDRIVSIPGQVGFTQLSMSSADMQFLESRKFTVRDICRFFGVHPSFVFDDTSNNYKSAEMANVAFLSNTLNPLLRKIENELHRKLVAPSLAGRMTFRFDRSELYAADLDSRVRYQAATIAAGTATINEWRAVENKPALPGGDQLLVSANLRPIAELNNHPAPDA